MKFDYYKWHSINLFPAVVLYTEVDDWTLVPTDRVLEITLFGRIFSVSWKSDKKLDARTLIPTFGPAFSRKKKIWRWDRAI
jgi:hypothetical protein